MRPSMGPWLQGSVTPGLDGGVIGPQSFGKAPEGREGTRGGARQPWLKLGWLALAIV
jgi:hypothetical protein